MRMPGGRDLRMPTISSTDAAIAATSMNENPRSHMSAPTPGSYWLVSGGYMNQPPLGAASKKIEPQRKTPPSRNAQNPYDERRGKGRSREPSICGRNRIDAASKIGIANR